MTTSQPKNTSRHKLHHAYLPASFWALLVLVTISAQFVPQFATFSNAVNVMRVSSILLLASLGQSLVIILAGIEFSIGSAAALCSIVTVFTLQSASLPVAFGTGFASVLTVGALNGLLISYARMPAFLATLGTLMLVHGLASVFVGGLPIEAPVSDAFYWLGRSFLFGVPMPVWIALAGLVLHHIFLTRSKLGRQFYLVGANENAALICGIQVRRVRLLGYILASVFVAVAALILTSRVASGQPNLYPNLPFETISACAVGGISLAGGRGTTAQVLIGVLIISVLNNIVVLLNLPSAAQLAALGAVIIVAVMYQNINMTRHRLEILTRLILRRPFASPQDVTAKTNRKKSA